MSDAARSGVFWDMIEGRVPPPPAAVLLGWRLLAIDPEQGTVRVEFEAKGEFLNPIGTVQGGILTVLRPARAGKLHGEGRVVRGES